MEKVKVKVKIIFEESIEVDISETDNYFIMQEEVLTNVESKIKDGFLEDKTPKIQVTLAKGEWQKLKK